MLCNLVAVPSPLRRERSEPASLNMLVSDMLVSDSKRIASADNAHRPVHMMARFASLPMPMECGLASMQCDVMSH